MATKGAIFIYVKTPEGKDQENLDVRDYSFHPKIRYHLADGRVFYASVQVWDENRVNFCVFHTDEVSRFADIQIDSYQVMDNQQLHLDIDEDGVIANKSKAKNFGVFANALSNFDILNQLRDDEQGWHAWAI